MLDKNQADKAKRPGKSRTSEEDDARMGQAIDIVRELLGSWKLPKKNEQPASR